MHYAELDLAVPVDGVHGVQGVYALWVVNSCTFDDLLTHHRPRRR